MFSEYASKFLAQSQSRISFASPQDLPNRTSRRTARPSMPRRQYPNQRTSLAQGMTGLGHFSFGSRMSQNAPLFQSVVESAGDADEDEEEHEREVADYFALQRSRKHFVQGNLEGSSEVDEAVQVGEHHDLGTGPPTDWIKQAHDIKSSWQGDAVRDRAPTTDPTGARSAQGAHEIDGERLDDNLRSVNLGPDESRVMSGSRTSDGPRSVNYSIQIRGEIGLPGASQTFRIPASFAESELASEAPTSANLIPVRSIYHDRIWGQIYLLTMVSFFTSFVLVWLHVSTPSMKHPIGDTVYTAVRASYPVLLIDTTLAVVVSIVWLAALRSYARILTYILVLGIPLLLSVFSLYSFISSFATSRNPTLQDKIMRWLSAFPLLIGGSWAYGIYKSKLSFGRAVDLLELAVKILGANPALVFVGFGTLASAAFWTWLWIVIFTHVFLGGHASNNLTFVIDGSTWWLGVLYVLIYLWTSNVISGLQRATTAATVSQWYFHRRSVPAVPSEAVVRAALSHAMTASFGTVCLSTLLALAVRLPVLLLPRRVASLIGVCSTALLPESLAILTHPTTLTYAAIHSQSLTEAARAEAQLFSLQRIHRQGVTGKVPSRTSAFRPHRLALLLLYAARLATSFVFGFGAWIHASHTGYLSSGGVKYKGSLYAYVVGLLAAGIGWAIIGAMEGTLTGIVDAVVVCWESDVSADGQSHYCKEAEWILGDGGESGRSGDEAFQRLLGRRSEVTTI